MMRLELALLLLLASASRAATPCESWLRERVPVDVAHVELSQLVESPRPWLAIEANSDQRQPLYLGASPRELAKGARGPERPRLYDFLKPLGCAQAARIRAKLKAPEAQFEAWPVMNDDGQLTWTFARWRAAAGDPWQWLDAGELELKDPPEGQPAPILPEAKKNWTKRDFSALFTDVLDLDSLYDKPLFGDAVWTRAGTGQVIAAWLPPAKLAELRGSLEENSQGKLIARIVPQPPRFNAEPVTFTIRAEKGEARIEGDIDWVAPRDAAATVAAADPGRPEVRSWPEDFAKSYEEDIRILSGRKTAEFPLSHRTLRFTRKNSIDPKNQLEDFVDYLEERYEQLGVRTVRQRFVWRGIRESNLIAVIPGRLRGAANKPILMADHIDTAFSEDAYNKTGKRISAPGADDNDTATAALLRAAEILKNSRPEHDIWLVHLTGEEFPADDLGARHFIEELLGEKKDIGGLVLMDMIGYRKQKDKLFQVNAGDDDTSLAIAATALDAAKGVAPEYDSTLRGRFDPKSYLYNTDGIVFANAGYPVILLNEHINGLENLNRPHYHQTTDTVDFLDFDYAAAISKVAIETVARLSKKQ